MIYGRTPFEHIKGQLNKWNAIVSPNEAVYFPHIENKAAIDIMKAWEIEIRVLFVPLIIMVSLVWSVSPLVMQWNVYTIIIIMSIINTCM